MLKPEVFREYDIRGIADKQLLDEDVTELGRGLATYVIRHSGKTISLGRDCRVSSDRLHAALLKGLLSTGAKVLDIGVVPTPVLYFSAVNFKSDGAVMITGSHSAPEYNGFKIVSGPDVLYGDSLQQLCRLIAKADFDSGEGKVETADAVTPYVDELARQFQFPRKVKVVLDAGNGTAGPVAHRLLKKLNVSPVELLFEMDGQFPNRDPDPTVPSNLKNLQSEVKKQKAELGVAFDCDADRIAVVDEDSRAVPGDMLLLIFGREILTRKPGATIVGDVQCSQVMYDELKELGGNPIMYKTGHSLIRAKMKQEHAELAGEMSGHIFFGDRYFGYDDAIYAACRLIEIVADSDQPLSAQTADTPKLVASPELRVACPDDLKFKVVERVAEMLRKRHEIIDVDGVRVPFAEGWALVRVSNTQPALVMRFQASSKEQLQQYRSEIEDAVDKARRELSAKD